VLNTSEGRSTHIEQSSHAGVERGDISLKICQNAKNLKKNKSAVTFKNDMLTNFFQKFG